MAAPVARCIHPASSGGFAAIIYGLFDKITPFRAENVNGGILGHVAYRLKKTVAMIGMMGSGKTAIGTSLARTLGVPFLDSDAEITQAANLTVPEIFERFGEPFFREKESQVIARLLKERVGILSTGGGAYLDARNRRLIAEKGVAVWLRADLALLWNRVRHKDTRPLLRSHDPYGTLKALLEAREPVYAEAELAVDASPDYSIDDMTGKVIETLLTRPDVLEREAA